MTRQGSLFCCALVASTLLSVGLAQAAPDCLGDLPNPLSIGTSLNIETNSRVITAGKFKLYEECAINRDPSYPVRIDWYVAGMHETWLKPGGPPNVATRVPTGDPDKGQPIESCIEYGLIGKTTTTKLLGIPADVADDAEHPGCKAANKPDFSKRVQQKLESLFYHFRVSVPSNPAFPEKSLITVQASVEAKPLSEKSYHSWLNYELQADTDDARLMELRLRPMLRGASELLTRAFRNTFPDGARQLAPNVKGDDRYFKGAIEFDVEGSGRWVLIPVRFQFEDAKRTPLGAIDLPLLAPAEAA